MRKKVKEKRRNYYEDDERVKVSQGNFSAYLGEGLENENKKGLKIWKCHECQRDRRGRWVFREEKRDHDLIFFGGRGHALE